MGCMLSDASCNKWWVKDILDSKDFAVEQTPITDEKLGRNHVFFPPYLMGERSPVNDTSARGAFIGLTMDNTRADITQAVLEGVSFAIRDSLEVARSLGMGIQRSKLRGGGVKSFLWRKMLANILNVSLDIVESERGPGMGGAMLAMAACGAFPSVAAACGALVKVVDTIEPEPELVALYKNRYLQFRKIYPTVKTLFPQIL